MKTVPEIAENLIKFMELGENIEAYGQLYAPNVKCIEADTSRSRSGRDRLESDMRSFAEAHDFRYTSIQGPIIAGDRFALALCFTAKNRKSGEEFTIREIGVYEVQEGRIVEEQYFYD